MNSSAMTAAGSAVDTSAKSMQELAGLDTGRLGEEMHALMTELFPICRSITGDGVRQTHSIVGRHINLQTQEVPTGTQVFDWIVPKEWNIRDAYIVGPGGQKIVDFKISNVHVLNYSVPVRARMSLDELRPHLHSLPDRPNAIPYKTSYYNENWGFCLSHNQLESLPDGYYEVVIDSTLEEGFLTYSECYLPGESEDEVLVSCYTCHPSLCNDNLSGTVLVTMLARLIGQVKTNWSYRFLFIPETIGAITWLAQNEDSVSKIKYGLVATCAGDSGPFTYKRSRRGDTEIDKAAISVLATSGDPYKVVDFFPSGSDERQFCSPGFNLAVGSLMRTPYADFGQYHNSDDNLECVRPEYLAEALSKYLQIFNILENNTSYVNTNPKCEPQLGKRGLYRKIGAGSGAGQLETALLWVLNYSDGDSSLLDISSRSNIPFTEIKEAADLLLEANLLEPAV